jgi:CBS domain containing-hemolysin-like protein
VSDPLGGGWLAALALVPVVLALFALSALLERSGPIRLRAWAEEAGGRLLAIHEDTQRFEVLRFLLSVASRLALVALLLAFLIVALGAGVSRRAAVLWSFLGGALVVAGADLLNRMLVVHASESALRRLTPVYRVLAFCTSPLAGALARLRPFRARDRGEEEQDEASDEEIEAFIDVGTREGILEPAQADLVRGVVDFGETLVRSVMTPRIDIIAAPIDATLEEAARLLVASRHSRLPVYTVSPDQIAGVLHILDVVEAMQGGGGATLRELVNPPLVVPDTKPLNQLLREFQSSGQQLAIVVNEHGSTAGLVTVEDLIEEIVGDIGVEYEPVAADGGREALPAGAWRLDGGTHVEELGELFDVKLEDAPFETLGGLVMSAVGAVPKAGESVVAHGLRFTVEAIDGRRIETVRVERAVTVDVGVDGAA